MMFRVVLDCFDFGNPVSYEDYLANDPKFSSVEEAYEYAKGVANDECDSLNEDCDELVSFGIVENEDKPVVTVNAYLLESEEDTTGETNHVTVYRIEAVYDKQ